MMPTSSRATTGVAILALLALVDISWLVEYWLGVIKSADAPPLPVLVSFALVGLVTLGAARPALRGHRNAAWTVVGSAAIAALWADLPALAFGAPGWAQAIAVAAIVLSALGIWWAAPLLRRTSAVGTGATVA